jgi:signal transduction histidine kinase
LIDDLLDLSRISRGELRVEAIDLTALARSITEELARESAHVMKVEIEEGLRTRGDARLVAVALQNLLSNAWKFSSKKTDAHVMVGWSPEHEAFFVRDNGAGFDMAYVDNLFRPFQRLHSQSEFEGSGIGLATVQRVVNRHRGRLWAEGVVGGGATFYFTVERD